MLKNFFDNIGTWVTAFLASVTTIVVAIIGVRKSKASKKVEAVEGDIKEFELKKSKEQYYLEGWEAEQQKNILLTEKFELVTGKLKQMQVLHDESLKIIEELKAERNMYKTIKSPTKI